ncbi:MAG: tetratricopeptide repeat protein [Sphingomicrobium sp.]
MKPTPTALALVLATSTIAFAAPASAQYGSSSPPPTITVPIKEQPAAKNEKKFNISNQARKEIIALQAAVNAKDVATIPAKLAAAQAKAKTADDKYIIAQLQLRVAVDANDTAAMASAIEAVVASGVLPAADTNALYISLGKLQYNAKTFDRAATSFERVLQLDPNSVDALVMLAETRNSQGRTADGVALLQKAISLRVAAGQKPEENWYKRAVALSFNANLASAPALARDWVSAYPSPKNWRDAIRIYQNISKLDDSALLDSMRLAHATGALAGENDYFRYTNTLVNKGFPGEAKRVLEEGFAAKSINKATPTFALLYAAASSKSQGDRASLGAEGKAALAAPAAKQAMLIGDAYYGYGDYALAAELYRAALTKTEVDKNLANLRLGMALTRSGDKAGATAALNAAGGAQADVAKLWLAFLATKA